jgi:hypothetical protein
MVRSFWKRTLVVALSCGGAGWGMAQQPPAATPPPSGKIITIEEPGKGKQECAILKEWPMPDGNIGRILMNLATGEEMTVIDSGHSAMVQAPSPYHAAGLTARIFHWGPNHEPPAGTPMPPDETVRLVPEPAGAPVVANVAPAPTTESTPALTSTPTTMPMPMEATPAQVHRGLFGSSWELSWRKGSSGSTMPSGTMMPSGTTVVSTVPSGTLMPSGTTEVSTAPSGAPVVSSVPSGTTVVSGDPVMESPPPVHRRPFARLFGKKSTDDSTMPADSVPTTTVTQLSPGKADELSPTKVTVISLDTPPPSVEATTAAAPPKKHLWPFHLFSGASEPKDVQAMAAGSVKDTVVTQPAKDTVVAQPVKAPSVTKPVKDTVATQAQPLDSNPWNRYKSPYTSLTAANAGAVATSPGQSSDWRRSWGTTATADGQGSLAVKPDDKTKKPAKPAESTAAADPKAAVTKPAKAAPTESAKVDPPKKDTPTVAVKVDASVAPAAPTKPKVEVAVDLPRAVEHKVDPLSDPAPYSRKPLEGIAATPAVPAALASNSAVASARGVAKLGKAPADAAVNKPVGRWTSVGAVASSKPGPELMPVVAVAPTAKPAVVAKVNVVAKVTAPAPAKEVTPVVAKTTAKVEVDNKVQSASAEAGMASTQPATPLGSKSVLAAYDARGGGVVYLPVPIVTLPPSSYVPPPNAPEEPAKPVAQATPAKGDATQDDLSANAFGPAVAPQPPPEEQMAYNAFARPQAPGPMPGMYPQPNMMPPMMMGPMGQQAMMPPPMMMGPMGQPVYQAAGYGYPAGMVVPAMVYPGAMQTAPVQAAGPQTVPQLLYSLRESLYPSSRQRAAESLATFECRDHPEVIDALVLGAREDPAASVRAGCVRSLSRVGNSSATVKATIEGLRTDPDQRVRQEAEEALTKINGSASPVNSVQPASALTHPQ